LPSNKRHRPTKLAPKKRRRRSTEEVIDLILKAASEEFERNGYEGATTAAIARRAGVAETVIFSNFGSKAKLFYDSIFKPFERGLSEFSAAHINETASSAEVRAEAQQYMAIAQQFIERQSKFLKPVIAAQLYAPDNLQGLHQFDAIHDFFAQAAALAKRRTRKKPAIEPALFVRISFASALACTLFKDWLFPRGLASDEEIRTAISNFIMDGLSQCVDRSDLTANPSGADHSAGSGKSGKKR
jgi:AcrR family transcriptional regulator